MAYGTAGGVHECIYVVPSMCGLVKRYQYDMTGVLADWVDIIRTTSNSKEYYVIVKIIYTTQYKHRCS